MKKFKKLGGLILVFCFVFLSGLMPAHAILDGSNSEEGVVNSITITADGADVSWVTDGYSSKGFKLVWSKNEDPTYPLRKGDKYNYSSSPHYKSDTVTAFSGSGTYHVRVCEYLGGKCGIYSNQIKVTLGNLIKDCTAEYAPVCGNDGNTYGNKCKLENAGITKAYYGECKEVVACTMEWDPVCGVDGKTYGNKCTLEAAGVAKAYYGECREPVICTMEWDPVCGVDGKTYGNKCTLNAAGVGKAYYGECKQENTLKSIKLEGTSNKIHWVADGYSRQGFKVVWSMNENPTYPTEDGDKYHYRGDSRHDTDFITPFSGNGTYYVRVCEYLGGKCGVYSNEIKVELTNAKEEGVKQIEDIRDSAKDLLDNKIDALLVEIRELRSIIREQQVQINHLMRLKQDLSQTISSSVESAINNFITYGVDDNTKRLGEGERAAVMYSYKAAFKKLPETEEELEDAIKIANGRWPSLTNTSAEDKAKAQFEKIYLRAPDMNDPRDAAAVKVMAYGLRQKAENRNLNSEKNGIKIFKSIFGKNPETTDEWNTMQAITYSGATR